MDGTLYYQYYDASRGIGVDENGVRIKTPFVSYGNWFKNFFQTGWTATNTLSVSGKINKNNAIRFSVTDYRSESIVPNSPWSKQSLSLKSNNKINRWLSVDTSLTYYRKDDDNLPVMGYGSSSIMYSLWCMSPNIDMNWAKQYWLPGQEHVQQDAGLSGGKNNPYFTAYEQLNTLDRDRMYGNTALNLHLYKGLDLMLRGGIDFSRDLRSTRHPKSSYSYKYGMYSEQELTSLQLSTDFLLKYDRKLGAGFNITANLGGSIINRSFVQTSKTAEQNFVSTQFLKLRELRLDYEFPKKWLSKTRIIKGLVLSVYGRDLFCWSDFPGWDPEGAFMRGSSVVPGFEIAQMPGTRAIGGSIKITF